MGDKFIRTQNNYFKYMFIKKVAVNQETGRIIHAKEPKLLLKEVISLFQFCKNLSFTGPECNPKKKKNKKRNNNREGATRPSAAGAGNNLLGGEEQLTPLRSELWPVGVCTYCVRCNLFIYLFI